MIFLTSKDLNCNSCKTLQKHYATNEGQLLLFTLEKFSNMLVYLKFFLKCINLLVCLCGW